VSLRMSEMSAPAGCLAKGCRQPEVCYLTQSHRMHACTCHAHEHTHTTRTHAHTHKCAEPHTSSLFLCPAEVLHTPPPLCVTLGLFVYWFADIRSLTRPVPTKWHQRVSYRIPR
jgi:hypothetical protein